MKFIYLILSILAYSARPGNCQCSSTNLRSTETVNLNDTIYEFSTPGYRIAYFPRMDCSWIFDTGTDSSTIVFDMQELLVESSRGCNYDFLAVHEGNTTSATRVSKLCGRLTSSSPTTFVTVSGRYALLRMKTDSSRQYAGASINVFYAIENSGNACSGSGASITATLDIDYITSPGYPVSLASNLDCTWTITSDVTTVIYIQIDYTDMKYGNGCPDQNLAIYDGTSSSDPAIVEAWCDSRVNFPSQATVYYTTSNNAFIQLTTSVAEGHGFRVNFRQNSSAITTTTTPSTTTTELVQVCSTIPTELEADNTTKYFRSANYPEYYPHNINCFWRITAPVGYMINLTFVDSDIQTTIPCSRGDYVSVYDGETSSNRMLTTFCGSDSPSLRSTGRYLFIQFKTDPSISFRGFSAQYSLESIVLPDCFVANLTGNYTVTETPFYFTSPDYPSHYNSSMEVSWLLYNPNQTQAIAIDVVDSRIENSDGCIYDSVKIHQGPCTSYPVISTFCGLDTPTIYYDTGAYALVVLTTDETLTYRGFNVSVYLIDTPEEDDSNVLIITGIVVGSVLGGLAVLSGITYLVYKYHNKRNEVGSRGTSRRSSSSSSSSDDTVSPRRAVTPRLLNARDKRFRLPSIKEFRP